MPDIIKNLTLRFAPAWARGVKRYDALSPSLFNLFLVVAVVAGWRLSRHELITPTHGQGLIYGFVGTGMMLLLFVYPLRKRVKTLTVIGTMKQWFQSHMTLGLLGPLLILYHCNFHLGAFNSNIALFSLLIVSASGVVGKHIYIKICQSLNGERTTLVNLQKSFAQSKEITYHHFTYIPLIKQELDSFLAKVITPTKVLSVSFRRALEVSHEARVTRHEIRRAIDAYLQEHALKRHWSLRRRQLILTQMERKSHGFLRQAVTVAEFNFYERVFYLWHVLHLPLTFIFIFTVVLHVLSVNRY